MNEPLPAASTFTPPTSLGKVLKRNSFMRQSNLSIAEREKMCRNDAAPTPKVGKSHEVALAAQRWLHIVDNDSAEVGCSWCRIVSLMQMKARRVTVIF